MSGMSALVFIGLIYISTPRYEYVISIIDPFVSLKFVLSTILLCIVLLTSVYLHSKAKYVMHIFRGSNSFCSKFRCFMNFIANPSVVI